jgi:radical SAM protein with 4Fe4S-binding SPASM domain
MKLETPKPNQFYYKMYMLVGLLIHPLRLWNVIKFQFSRFSAKVNYLPTMMDLEPNQKCNFRCIMCTPFKQKREDMTFDEFKKIVDAQYGLIEIKIQGVGEPFLNKDFISMIKYARRKMLWVRTTTNGSLLHLNDNYRHLVDSGVHDINISIDGATKPIYEAIRVGGSFEQLCANCRLINDYNNRTEKTVVRAWVVMQKLNKDQFLEFPRFFADLGFKEMTISFAMHNYGRDGANTAAETFGFGDEDFGRLFSVCQQVGIKPSFFFHPRFTAEKFCQIPFKRVYVTTDGHILPCCYIANQEVVEFGSYDDFNRIWFDKYNEFRRALKEAKSVPPYCRDCYGVKS